jgi:hypothetical protein
MKKIGLQLAFCIMVTAMSGQVSPRVQLLKMDRLTGDQMDQDNSKAIQGSSFSPEDLGNPPQVNWLKQYGGDGYDVAQDVILDSEGNSYVTGWFSGPVNFGGGSLTSAGYTDAFVVKYSSSGSLVWLKQLSCQSYQVAKGYGIALDNSNNVYVTGFYNGTTFKTGDMTLTKTGSEDLFIVKYDKDGTLIMANHFGYPGNSLEGLRVAADNDGSILILCGGRNSLLNGGQQIVRFNSSGTFQRDYTNGAYFMDLKLRNSILYLTGYLTSEVHFDAFITLTTLPNKHVPFIAKCSTDFQFEWAVQGIYKSTASAYNRSYSISLDGTGNIYISGRFRKTIDFGNYTITNSMYSYIPFVVKCDPAGNFLWAKQAVGQILNPDQLYNSPVKISADISGNTSLAFETVGDTLSFGIYTVTGPGYSITRYDPDGLEKYPSKLDGTVNNLCTGVNDQVVLAGTKKGNLMVTQYDADLNPVHKILSSGNSGIARTFNLKSSPDENIYLYGYTETATNVFGKATGTFFSKMKPNGDTVWTVPFEGGSSYTVYGDFITIDRNDDVYITGYFSDTLRIKEKRIINPSQNEAIFLVKMDKDGKVLWLEQVGNGSGIHAYSLTSDNDNNLLLVGTFSEVFTIGAYQMNSAGSDDIFIAKFNSSGGLLWAKRAGGDEIEWEGFVSTDSLNNIYVAGEFLSRSITIGDIPATLSQYEGDILLLKFSPNGSLQFIQNYGGDPGGDSTYGRLSCWPVAIKTTSSGDCYLYGWTGMNNYYGSFLLQSPYDYNFFLTRLDHSGNVLWAKIIQEQQYGLHSMQIDLDKQGSVYFGGNMRDTVYFEDQMAVNQGTSDLFLGKYKKDGALDWVKLFSSNPMGSYSPYSVTNQLYGIAVYDSASIFFGGESLYDIKFGSNICHTSAVNGFVGLLGQPVNGIDPLTSSIQQLFIYPNPACDVIYFNAGNRFAGKFNVEILTADGRLLLQEKGIYGKPVYINVTEFSPGLYFVRLNDVNTTLSGTFIKK